MRSVKMSLASFCIKAGHGAKFDWRKLVTERDRVKAKISLAPGTLIMIDGVQPMVVLESGWLLDGEVFTSTVALHNRLHSDQAY